MPCVAGRVRRPIGLVRTIVFLDNDDRRRSFALGVVKIAFGTGDGGDTGAGPISQAFVFLLLEAPILVVDVGVVDVGVVGWRS